MPRYGSNIVTRIRRKHVIKQKRRGTNRFVISTSQGMSLQNSFPSRLDWNHTRRQKRHFSSDQLPPEDPLHCILTSFRRHMKCTCSFPSRRTGWLERLHLGGCLVRSLIFSSSPTNTAGRSVELVGIQYVNIQSSRTHHTKIAEKNKRRNRQLLPPSSACH